METPGLFGTAPKSRSWFLELLWPILDSDVAAETALRNGMYVCFAFALLSALAGLAQKSFAGAIFSVLYLAFLGIGVRAGSRFTAVTAFIYFALSFTLAILTAGAAAISIIPLIGMGLLLGAVRASLFLAAFRRRNAASATPPDLPEAAFYDSAPAHLREMAQREVGFENRVKSVWSVLSPLPEVVTGLSWIFICVLIAFIAVCHAYLLSTASMAPTLGMGDRVIALNSRFMGSVHRGDIVSLKYPLNKRVLIFKRVVGHPGDHIQVRADKLILNGNEVHEPYLLTPPSFRVPDFPSANPIRLPDLHLEALSSNMYQRYIHQNELVVPPDTYFVLGDNRGNSLDSRYFGPIPAGDVTGRAIFVYGNDRNRASPMHFVARPSLPSSP